MRKDAPTMETQKGSNVHACSMLLHEMLSFPLDET